MSRIEQKQPLPFAFYDDINKQNRNKTQCTNYMHHEYLLSSGCRLLPFQIRGNLLEDPFVLATLQITLVNVETGTQTSIESHIDVTDLEVVEDASGNSYISYFGKKDILDGSNCIFDNCIYYLIVNDSGGLVGTWYSEVFEVVNVTASETGHIKWNQTDNLEHDSGDKLDYN